MIGGLASILVLISGFTHAIVTAILKSGKDKMSGRALIDGFSAILALPFAFFVPLPAHAWGWLAASWAVHLLYLYTLIKSFEQSDMTVAYPIARGLAPVLTALVVVTVFHEDITFLVALGIALIAAGVMFIGVSHTLEKSAPLWAALTGSCIAGYTVIDAQGVRADCPPSGAVPSRSSRAATPTGDVSSETSFVRLSVRSEAFTAVSGR